MASKSRGGRRPPRRADVGRRAEDDPLGLQLLEPAVQEPLLHLELGDAVAQQPADPVRLLEDGDPVSRAVQLLGRGEARRAGSHDGHLLPGADGRRLSRHPASANARSTIADLDGLDGHRVVVDAEHARAFARRRTQPPGEVGEVVGRVQAIDRRSASGRDRPGRSSPESGCPAGSPGDRTGCRSPCSARPAVRARLGIRQIHFAPVVKPLCDRPRRLLLAVDFDEPVVLPMSCTPARGRRTPRPRHPLVAPTSSENSGSRDSARALASARSTRR